MLKIVLLSLLLCNNLSSQDISLGTVIVNPEAQSNSDASMFSSVINKDNTNTFQDLPTIIQKETSVQVRQSGGLGSFSSVSLRGSSSNQVIVLLDGVPINDSSGSGVDLSSIPYSQIRTIEIYRGNAPSILGKGGIGGTVNIKTIKASDKLNANVMSSYSSFNTFKIATSISQKAGAFDYTFNSEYFSSKNNFSFLNNKGTEFNSSDDKWDIRNNSQFWHASIFCNAGYDISKNARLELYEQYFNKDQHLPSQNNSPITNAVLSTERNIVSIKANYFNASSRLDYTYKNEYYDDKDGTLSMTKQWNKYTTNNYGLNQTYSIIMDHNVIDIILDAHREIYRIQDLLHKRTYHDSSRNNYSFSLENKILLSNEKLIVTPALTTEHYDTDIGTTNKSTSNTYFNPKIGGKYEFIHNVFIKSNIAKYTREPSFFELIGDRGFFVGNDTLKAEQGVNFDIGAELRNKDIGLEIAYFRNNVNDVISYVYDSSGVGHAVNISRSTISGIESSLMWQFLEHFSMNANYTWQLPVNHSQIAIYEGKNLPGRFKNSFFVKLQAQYNNFRPYYEFLYENGIYYDSANLLPAPQKKEHNIGINFYIHKLTLTGEIKNLTNNNYQDFNGFPTPGRSYWLTASYSI